MYNVLLLEDVTLFNIFVVIPELLQFHIIHVEIGAPFPSSPLLTTHCTVAEHTHPAHREHREHPEHPAHPAHLAHSAQDGHSYFLSNYVPTTI